MEHDHVETKLFLHGRLDVEMATPPRAGFAAIRAFVGLRSWNVAYYRTLSAAERARVGMHPERGEESAETTIRLCAGHDRNHLAQLEAIAAMPVVDDEDASDSPGFEVATSD